MPANIIECMDIIILASEDDHLFSKKGVYKIITHFGYLGLMTNKNPTVLKYFFYFNVKYLFALIKLLIQSPVHFMLGY
jgi:hypothetical protein